LPLLKSLSLSYSDITDGGLRHLAGLTNLQNLELRWSSFRGDGLAHLSSLRKLWRFDLTRSRVATGFHPLFEGSLRVLQLADTRVDDAALVGIGRLSKLTALELDGTRITSSGLAHLVQLKDMTHLSAARTVVDDSGIRTLAGRRGRRDNWFPTFNLQD